MDGMSSLMMDPEMMRLAQEQMSRMPPDQLARMQQMMMSNPELVKLATEGLKDFRPEDVKKASEQLKYARTEDMAEMAERMANSSPEEIAAIRARNDAEISYILNAAEMLKKQGNNLHGQGKYREAAQKYLLAKNNLNNLLTSKGRTLSLACSVNLMSCYLKTGQYEDCIKEGSQVLASDEKSVKALYRRGQAYKEIENLEAAISDLTSAHELSPDDETIADVLRDTKEKFAKCGFRHISKGLVIEEIVDEDVGQISSASTVTQHDETVEHSQSQSKEDMTGHDNNVDCSGSLRKKSETVRSSENFMSSSSADPLASLREAGKISPDMVTSASNMISKMPPEELQRMLEMASSMSEMGGKQMQASKVSPDMLKSASEMIGKMSPEELKKMFEAADSLQGKEPYQTAGPSNKGAPDMVKSASEMISRMSPDELQKMLEMGSSSMSEMGGNHVQASKVSPDMLKTASEMIGKMSPEELQKMFEVAASLSGKDPYQTMAPSNSRQRGGSDVAESSSSFSHSNLRIHPASKSHLPNPNNDMQEQIRNTMKDPAMREMLSTMMKNMSPDMMSDMSQRFGIKMSPEEAAKAQQAMSSLSPDALDKMMRWADRIQRTAEGARKTKNWLLGKPGMIVAICMLILAIILHRLGFIGG